MFMALGFLSVAMYFALLYAPVAIENVEFGFRCRIDPFWEANVRPIFADIIRPFFNAIICWWNALMWFPYGVIRQVIFPLMRECGFYSTMRLFASFLSTLAKDILIDYIATRQFLQADLDFTNIVAAWQAFFISLQQLFCCGCNDLCPIFTKTPLFIPPFFMNALSDQWRDSQTWCFFSNTFNGMMKFLQESLDVLKEKLYPVQGTLPRPVFREAFDRWCDASTCFWKSWENAFQTFWDAFVPFDFIWEDLFCMFDVMTCASLRFVNLLLTMLANYDKVLDHFTNKDSTFWVEIVKEDFKEIVNLWGPATYFDPITQVLPDTTVMEITSYQLLNTVEGKVNGKPNPLFGKQTAANCSCIFITRILCDPLNNGTTCAQQYNGTLLETFDFCCFGTNVISFMVDMWTWMFEITLQLKSVDNFIVYLDRQPFSTFLKTSFAGSLECLYGVFLAVDVYGKCIQTVLSELTLFVTCMMELFYRVFMAAVTLPYFETNLPGICNFLTCPGEQALAMAIGFLDRLVSTGPDSLINCMCFLLNTGFPVPPAGCTLGCVVGGFVTPTMKKDPSGASGWRAKLNPIYNYANKTIVREWNAETWWEEMSFQKTGDPFRDFSQRIDIKLDRFVDKLANRKCQAEKLVTSPPDPPIVCDPPPACFNLCCFPKSILVLAAHTTAFAFRALNAAFQTRNGMGSPYFDGTGCGSGPCLQSDATAFVVNLIAPLKCVCNGIHLVIRPTGFPDPCCFFTLLGEFLSCTLQVVFNVITSVTSDPNYTYIKSPGGLTADFDVLLGILNATFDCACSFIRIIFGLILTVQDLLKNYDPCCLPTKLFRALIEVLRLIGQILLSLATLEQESSQCYFYIQSTFRPNCEPTLFTLPVLVQFDRIRAVLLAPPSAQVQGQCGPEVDPNNQNQDEEGIATCICTLLNAVLAQVFKPDPNQPAKCPIDLCCMVYNINNLIDELLYFVSRLIASFWQNWEPREEMAQGMQVGPYDIPVEFIDFFFCDEYLNNPLGGPLGMHEIVNPTGITTDKCGRFEPVLDAWGKFLTGCFCSPGGRGLGDVADNFLQWFLAFVSNQATNNIFPISVFWPKCLCHGGPDGTGIVPPLGDLLVAAMRQVIILIRNINNPSYWAPSGGSLTDSNYVDNLSDNLEDIRKTWIARFLTPFAEAACRFVTNAGCLLSMVLGNKCEISRYNLLSSIIRYLFEAAIYGIAVIEAFVKMLAQELPGQCVGNPDEYNGSAGAGQASSGAGPQDACAGTGIASAVLRTGTVFSNNIGSILVALTSFVVDALIGVGALGCSAICPVEVYTNVDTAAGIAPEVTACACYNKTPYTATSARICNFTVCETYGAPADVCPGGGTECSVDEVCGAVDASPGNCPRLTPDNIFQIAFFFSDCNGGCKNMTEAIEFVSPIVHTWDQALLTKDYPWYPTNHPILSVLPAPNNVPTCTIGTPPGNVPGNVFQAALDQFGGGMLAPVYQPICRRSFCVSRGFCKNDKNVSCAPGDPRGILDGIVMAALKYLRCILDIIFNGLGVLMDPIIGIVGFFWQLSGGIIRFVVAVLVTFLQIIITPFFINFFRIIPQVLNLFVSFLLIFVQPAILAAKDGTPTPNNNTHVNPLEQLQLDEYGSLLQHFFGVNMDGCIEDPIPCFCANMNISEVCHQDISRVSLPDVAMLMSKRFEGLTECDSLIHHAADMRPTLWSHLTYSERFQYIDCVARRVQGEHFNNKGTDAWPKDFFYAQDGWYKLYSNVKKNVVNHINRVAKQEKRLRKHFEKDMIVNLGRYYDHLDSRAQVVENMLYVEKNVDRMSPAISFLVHMDHFWYKWRTGYYNMIVRSAWNNVKKGNLPFGDPLKNFQDMKDSLVEIKGAFTHLSRSSNLRQNIYQGMDAIGRMTHDILYNGGKNVGNFHTDKTVPSMPTLLAKIVDGSIMDALPNIQTNVKTAFVRTGAHIWKHLNAINLRFSALSWRKAHWTPEKVYNYQSFLRLGHRLYYTLWPQYTTQSNYEKFILGGNCKVADGIVNLGSEIVNYCLDNFNESIVARGNMSPAYGYTHNSFFKRFHGRLEWKSRYPGGKLRPRVIIPEKPARHRFHRDVYRRAAAQPGTPGDFDLYKWVISLFDNWFDLTLGQDIADRVTDINAWFVNPNIDPASYPNVGFRYWITFPFRCEHPENTNCSIGSGLEDAVIKVTWVFLVVFIVSALFFPALWSLLGGLGALVLWFFIVLAVGFHYSPACLVMWPSFTVRPGLTIPMFPVPISTFVFPECTWDEIVGVTDKYITNDYSFLINASLVNGPVAPPCDEKISFFSCREVGMGDGIKIALYWMYRWFGSTFCEIIIGLASTSIGRLYPPLAMYLIQALDAFKTASPTEAYQQEVCGKWFWPSIALPLLIVIPTTLFLLFFIPAIINVLVAGWAVLRASPLFAFIASIGGQSEYTSVEGENEEPLPPEEGVAPIQMRNVRFVRRPLLDTMTDFLKQNFIPGWRPVKRKKE